MKRVLIVAGLGVIGLGVIALLSRGDDEIVGRGEASRNTTADVAPDTNGGAPDGQPGVLEATDGTIQRTDPKTGDLIQEFRYASLTPKEQGVFDMTKPRARMFLERFRVIQMESDTGRFVMPNNNLETGEFTGNLVITVFQCDPDEKLDLSPQSPHRIVKIKLDHATFNATLGEVRSDSKLELMTPATRRAYFRGQGLTLVYNEVASRVDYLEITKGDMLRYSPSADETAVELEPKPDKPKDPSAEPKPVDPEKAEPRQYYQVTFDRQVQAVSEGRVIEADSLEVYFALDRPRDEEAGEQPGKPAPATSMLPMASPYAPNVWPIVLGQIGEPKRQRISNDVDAPYPSDDDVVLTWTGKMVMEPVKVAPTAVLAGPDDIFVKFVGSPTRVILNDRDTMVCKQIEYLDSTKTATAIGTPAFPLRLESPVLGVVTAPKLTANIENNSGQLVGAGTIRAPEKQPEDGADRLPPGFKIDWSERVDLAFATPKKPGAAGEPEAPADPAKPRDPASQVVAGIESATFIGDVIVEDRQMKLTSESLTAAFDIAPGGGDRQLSRIDATGGVNVAFEDASIVAKDLRVLTAPNKEGRLTPVRVVADGRVVVTDPTQEMQANSLDITLVERAKTPKTADANTPVDASKLSINERLSVEPDKVTAIGDVVLRMLAKDTRVFGDRLNADAAKGTAVLLGDPVRILRGGDEAKGIKPEAELIVPKLNLERDGRVALAEGKGVFVWTQVESDALPPRKAGDPGDKPAPQKAPARRVKVTWTDRMRFDDAADLIQVYGNVVAEAEDSPQELNKLTAQQMTLELIDPRKLAAAIDIEPIEGEAPPIDSGLDRRQLRRLTAREDVVLLATKWTDSERKKVETRVRMAGPLLVFNNITEQAQIIGPGSMLIEDRRPPKNEPVKTKATPISGRGATVFTWTNRLLLDNIATDMTMEGDVQMTHDPDGTEALVELKTQKLLADLESATAIRAMGLTRSDAMVIRKVDAAGKVQVHDHGSNRLVTSDRLIYDGLNETILLTADDGRKVNVVQLDKPKPVKAATIFWDLKNDTVEVRDVGF